MLLCYLIIANDDVVKNIRLAKHMRNPQTINFSESVFILNIVTTTIIMFISKNLIAFVFVIECPDLFPSKDMRSYSAILSQSYGNRILLVAKVTNDLFTQNM